MNFINQMKAKYRLLLHYLGIVLMLNGAILILPLISLIFYRDESSEAIFFLLPAILVGIIGFVVWYFTKSQEQQVKVSIKEGGIIVVLSWIIICIASAMPFVLSGQLNFTQAVFESVSGWTTTGLSVVDVTKTSHIFLIWRSTMQFFGGAGIAVIVLASIIGPSGLGLYSAEGRTDLLLPNITKSAKLIMTIYIGYILSGTILYIIAGMPVFDAINHSIAALSTGGFSTVPNSIGQYNNLAIELITLILMFLGTVNFAAHYLVLKGEFKKFIQLGEIKLMFFLLSIMIPLVTYFSMNELYHSLGKGFRVAIFELTSALSTTGFSTVSYSDWNDFGILAMIVLMIIGGGTGSTAGGIKQYRIYVLYKSLLRNLKGFILPSKHYEEISVNKPEGRVFLKSQEVINVSNFVFIYIIIYIIGVSIMLMNGYPLRESLFEYASSIGTVGLSVGITSASAPISVLWAQIIGMLFGRLEIMIIFYAIIKIFKDLKMIRNKAGII
ncbi:TrkH family potassium uptake protein [Petrocella sp. FN5]|uniref:TrkH family potassium uptake protein n=1 Tax=Petrocella sp. FN5 TaxID=3032002 RepID=UPI0023DA62CF|nr:potassium transporter TrkG [Petrocella sp. FN5]MDF1615940.1 potassium transporter TrkG [Petrocella sp. FN5]